MNSTSAASGESLIGLAMLGKVAGVLIVLVIMILVCAWLTRRVAPGLATSSTGPQLKIVTTKALGPREKVVVLEVENQWLLLGVGGSQINHLHTLPAAIEDDSDNPVPGDDSFASRLGQALGQNLRGMRGRGDRS